MQSRVLAQRLATLRLRALRTPPCRTACHSRCCCAFESENPQNTAPPLRCPSSALSPADAVLVQLEAAASNDTPRESHAFQHGVSLFGGLTPPSGVHTLYEFAADAGGMERSRYFGLSKDLYHLDHFLAIRAMPAYAPLFRNVAFSVAGPVPGPDGCLDVWATVVDGSGEHEFVFRMTQRTEGSKAGCWLVEKLLPKGSKYL